MDTGSADSARWTCPQCGAVEEENIKIYRDDLREQNFTIYPVFPTCMTCGSPIVFHKQKPNNRQKAIILTGTCASGKSSTAEILMSRYGFYGIEGDCVKSVITHKTGVKDIEFNAPEMFDEIANEIDILVSLQKDIVLSHVIVPEDFPRFREILRGRRLDYRFIVLQPDYPTAFSRSKTRDWYNTVTPEKWVKHFHDIFHQLEQQENSDIMIFDNSDLTVEESARRIIALYNKKTPPEDGVSNTYI